MLQVYNQSFLGAEKEIKTTPSEVSSLMNLSVTEERAGMCFTHAQSKRVKIKNERTLIIFNADKLK
jgi:hypothetical protein